MKINGAELLIKILENLGVKFIAGIPGGANLPIYDALSNSSIVHILARHEQAAGFIAQGISRICRNPGVCLATSGPGATNLLTALADANSDSIPLIAITGQVSSNLIGTNAFQEVDICAMANPIIKKSFQVKRAKDLINFIPEAFFIAMEGRRGPVLIDIPRDVQSQILDVDKLDSSISHNITQNQTKWDYGNDSNLESILIPKIIEASERPIVYFGGGILHSNAAEALRDFVFSQQIPVVSTLMGLGALEFDNPFFLGMLGMHGTVAANLSLDEADLIIGIGVRFDDRATGDFAQFCPDAKLIHIDIDSKSIHKNRIIDYPWQIDANEALKILLQVMPYKDRSLWLEQIEKNKTGHNNHGEGKEQTGDISEIIGAVYRFSSPQDIIVTDVGQHQMWVAQYFPFQNAGRFLTSGGLGTMGFGLPAAIGAALAAPEKNIICFTGDGSIMMNIQELATLSELNLNVKLILLNNGHLGLVRQQQHLFFNQNYFASEFRHRPDFQQIAAGFGIKSFLHSKNSSLAELFSILENFFAVSGPCLLEIEIDHHEKVFPMVPPGQANTVMLLS